jgi:ABC-type Fe3+-siderophore transport system permease subunit
MSDQQPYWTRVAETRRHIYFSAADQWPGIVLFGLIGIGGVVAAVVGASHWLNARWSHSDWILVGVAISAVWLAVVQGWRLISGDQSSGT